MAEPESCRRICPTHRAPVTFQGEDPACLVGGHWCDRWAVQDPSGRIVAAASRWQIVLGLGLETWLDASRLPWSRPAARRRSAEVAA